MKNLTLTALETQLLKGLAQDKDEYMDGSVEYRACNESSLHHHITAPKKSVGGVVASLLKKGLIELAFIDDVQVDGSFNFREEKFYSITAAGLKAIQAEEAQDEVQAEDQELTFKEKCQITIEKLDVAISNKQKEQSTTTDLKTYKDLQEEIEMFRAWRGEQKQMIEDLMKEQENKVLSLSDCVEMTCEQLHITVANALKVLAGIYKQNDKREQGQEIAKFQEDISWMNFEHSREFRDVKVIDQTKANLKKRIEALDSIKYDALYSHGIEKELEALKKELAKHDYNDLELELMCVEISYLTHWNHHNEALLLLAETIGEDWQVIAINKIIAKHKELKEMTPMLIETREKMRKVLFTDKSFLDLSPELQAKIKQAF